MVGTEHGHGSTILWLVGSITSLLTAIYMFRLVFLTFHGAPRSRRPAQRDRAATACTAAHGAQVTRTRSRLSRPSRRAARGAAVDGDSADHPRDRLGLRRLRRRAARPRGRQPHRDVPRAECSRCTRLPKRRAAAEGAAVSTAEPARRSRTITAADAERTERHADGALDRRRRSPASASPFSSGCADRTRRGTGAAVRRRLPPAAQQVLRRRDLRRGDRAADQASARTARCGRASTPV